MSLAIGIDIGTSGARAAAVDRSGRTVAEGRAPLASEPYPGTNDPRAVDAESWWRVAETALGDCLDALHRTGMGHGREEVRAIAVDGTSGSMVLVDGGVRPLTHGLLYDAGGFDAEAKAIAPHAPPSSIARGPGSALARLLHLQSHALRPGTLCHQADFVAARLIGAPGLSDESNALKTGYDPHARAWPDWLFEAGARRDVLPEVRPVGAPFGTLGPVMTERFGLPSDVTIVAGASDGTAAFLGATDGVAEPGTAVTSLGTTLTLKIASPVAVEDATRGIYSHRVGDTWLPGGASNTGGGALLKHFKPERIAELSERIDPDWEPAFAAYPLPGPGERFPTADPFMEPIEGPRPGDDTHFLHALLHGIARIERDGYRALADLGAPYPTRVLTSGGGAANRAWTAIRQRLLGVPVERAEADPALGMARLAMRAMR